MVDVCISLTPMFRSLYGNLAKVGLSLTVMVSLQSEDLILEKVMWTLRCSGPLTQMVQRKQTISEEKEGML
jgi:hypothetical protein